MKISRIKVENFRSIKLMEIDTNDFNLFVGQNNCGKTNLFEALEFFFNGLGRGGNIDELKYKRQPANEITVEVEFIGAIEGAERMQNAANKTKIQRILAENDRVVVVRSSVQSNKRKVLVQGNEVNPGTGFDAALNDFLPKFEYINTKQYYDSVAKFARTTPIGIMLSGVLTAILESNPHYQGFQETFRQLFEDENSQIKTEFDTIGNNVTLHLQKQFPDASKVKFEVTAPEFDDLLKNFSTWVDDGVETSAEEKGDGMQRALMLAIIQAYAQFRKQNEDLGKSFLFFIDEAELHLHPTAQRSLKNVLYDLSQNSDQVFINTHSSVFIADNFPNQALFKIEKHQGESEVEVITDREKPYVVYELLGGSPSDLLLPKNFLIVEGQSEFELLTAVISRFYTDKPEIQIIKANGDVDQAQRSINAIEKIYNPLNASLYRSKVIVLLDQPSVHRQAGFELFKSNYPHLESNNQLFTLPNRDIEQCYPDQPCSTYVNWKKTQDELDAVSASGAKIIDGRKKRQLAKYVGRNITQQQFETDLDVAFSALEKCWELAYN